MATALTLAWPLASVVAVADDSVADAPVAGAAKVTATPLSGLPAASLTSTCSGTAKGARTVVLCGVPPVAVMVDAVPAVIVKALLCAETSDGADGGELIASRGGDAQIGEARQTAGIRRGGGRAGDGGRTPGRRIERQRHRHARPAPHCFRYCR